MSPTVQLKAKNSNKKCSLERFIKSVSALTADSSFYPLGRWRAPPCAPCGSDCPTKPDHHVHPRAEEAIHPLVIHRRRFEEWLDGGFGG